MLPFTHLKRKSMDSAEEASKRVKLDRTAIFCLQPAEIQRAAKTACEKNYFLARKFLWESMLENDQLKNANSRPRNKIVEHAVDQHLGHIIQGISEEIISGVREFFAAKVYEHVETSNEFAKFRDVRRIHFENSKNKRIDDFLKQKAYENQRRLANEQKRYKQVRNWLCQKKFLE